MTTQPGGVDKVIRQMQRLKVKLIFDKSPKFLAFVANGKPRFD